MTVDSDGTKILVFLFNHLISIKQQKCLKFQFLTQNNNNNLIKLIFDSVLIKFYKFHFLLKPV
jgi:hypothetical protein